MFLVDFRRFYQRWNSLNYKPKYAEFMHEMNISMLHHFNSFWGIHIFYYLWYCREHSNKSWIFIFQYQCPFVSCKYSVYYMYQSEFGFDICHFHICFSWQRKHSHFVSFWIFRNCDKFTSKGFELKKRRINDF